jgi:type III restriction enzyme
MPRKRRPPAAQVDLLDVQARLRTAPCVPALREAVKAWRAGGYKGITDTTRLLLNHWFYSDHRLPDGRPFRYHPSQQDAIETLIFAFEFEKVRRRLDLLRRYAQHTPGLRLPPFDDFARYCIKMATGSGKTKVMSLAVVWQFLNAVREKPETAADYARTFLVLAPNVIVFERLRTDFAGGRIFRADPLIPKALDIFWDFECVLRGDGERPHSEGLLFLTNIQQFYERPASTSEEEPEEITAVLGPKPPAQPLDVANFADRIALRDGPLLVVNDEAHHTHDEQNEWNRVIRDLHARAPLAAQLDFSATPRYQKGALFPWTIFDYPLKQAIIDGIVKRPVKGIADVEEARSDIASTRYEAYLVAGVERWKEYSQQLAPLNKKPVLFVMLNSTDEADEVADWLRRKYPSELGGEKTLVIHTDRAGEVSKRDLDKARQLAREVDEDRNPVNAIVSVLMLREGWDVQNVTVVVGLRPYTAKANILPEQTIGRGLRLMFRHLATTYIERVDVLGNAAFLEFVDDLEKLEELTLDTFQVGRDKLTIVTILPMEEKKDRDIGLPLLSPLLVRKKSVADEIAALDVMSFACPVLPKTREDHAARTFRYEGKDIITLEKIVEREYAIPEPQTAQEVIGYYARRIAEEVKLPAQFAALAPKVKEFFEHKAFGEAVDLSSPAIVKAMGTNVAHYVVVSLFRKALLGKIIEAPEPTLVAPDRMLSDTAPFPWSGPTYEATRCILNLVPCDNGFERDFAQFLQCAGDSGEVDAFSKLPQQFGFAIDYQDANLNPRAYYPDWVARDTNGGFWLLETKGAEDVDVEHQDRAATLWCEAATALTGRQWRYVLVRQKEFESLRPTSLAELSVLQAPSLFPE